MVLHSLRRTFIRGIRVGSQLRAASTSERSVDFGFQKVREEEKEEKVYEVFENVAEKYDVMNDAMSLGIHRLWKDAFMERLGPTHGTRLLDVAGGTGDIAFRFLTHVREKTVPAGIERVGSHVTVSDINQAMLDVGRKRAEKGLKLGQGDSIDWLCANAEDLKQIPDESYSAYTIAFGIRNVTHKERALREAWRVLRKGGRFLCLEFSKVTNPTLHWFYDQYSFQVIPALGQIIAGDWKSYQYLVESIRMFPDQEEFSRMIREAGFSNVTYENLTFGVVAIHSGFKL